MQKQKLRINSSVKWTVFLMIAAMAFSCQEEPVEPQDPNLDAQRIVDFGNINVGSGDCIQASGQVITEERVLGEFSEVVVDGPATLVITQGSTSGVIVEAKEDVLPIVITEVSGDILTVSIDGCIIGQSNIIVKVTTTTIESVSAGASGVVNSHGELIGQNLDIDITGTGSVNLNLDYDVINFNSGSAGISTLSGIVDDLNIDLAGSTQLKAFDLSSSDCVISAGSTSAAEISIDQSLDATVTGLARVTYRGNPTITSSVSFLGKLIDGN